MADLFLHDPDRVGGAVTLDDPAVQGGGGGGDATATPATIAVAASVPASTISATGIFIDDDFDHALTGYDATVGTPAIVSSPVRSGSGALEIATSATAENVQYNVPAGNRRVAMSFYIRLPSVSLADNTQFGQLTGSQGEGRLRFDSVTGQIEATIIGGGTATIGGPVLAANTWYLVDLEYDTSTTSATLKVKVDSGTEFSATKTITAADIATAVLGTAGAQTVTAYYEDWLASNDSGAYPIGPHGTAGGDATATPATIAATVSVPAPTTQAAALTAPSTTAVAVSVPAPTVLAGAIITPATVGVAAAVLAPSVLVGGNVTVSATTVAVAASIPAPTVQGAARPTPATAAIAASIPAPTVLVGGNATATPATIAATVSVPAPTVRGTATVTPSTIAIAASVPTPSVLVGGSVAVSVATIAIAANVPTPAVLGTARTTPATVIATSLVGTPVLRSDRITTPATIAVSAAVGAPTLRGTAVVVGVTITGMVALPTPTVFGGEQGQPVKGPTYTRPTTGRSNDTEPLAGPSRSELIGAGHNTVEDI